MIKDQHIFALVLLYVWIIYLLWECNCTLTLRGKHGSILQEIIRKLNAPIGKLINNLKQNSGIRSMMNGIRVTKKAFKQYSTIQCN